MLHIRWPLFIRWARLCFSKCVFSFLFFIHFNKVFAQEFIRVVDSVSVERNGVPLELPFFGGLDRFIPQFVDMDGDSDLDLFISDSDGQLAYLENIGSPRSHKFHLIPDAHEIINVGSWFYLVDIDADGDFDLYCADGNGGLTFYRNTGSTSRPNFVLETRTVLAAGGQKVFSDAFTSIPTFADIDADDDFDFFTGRLSGEIRFYSNIGSLTSPLFNFVTDKWEDLLIISFGKALGLSKLANNSRHGASAIAFADLDGDDDFDFFYGDLFHNGMYFLRNDGTPENPEVAITDTLFPRQQPVITAGYNVPRFADIDADGDQDFFVACLLQSRNNFIFYKNTGNATTPQLQHVTDNLLTMLDVGSNSAPAFADIDNDGDQDFFIGNVDGQIGFYENIGSATTPAFRWITDALSAIQANTHFSATPTFTDIDADGDFDLFVGSAFGKIGFYENRGSPSVPSFVLVTLEYENISVGGASAPCFADFDHDGDADLFVAASNGAVISIYQNIGSKNSARFQFKKIIRHSFGAEDGVPFLYDWNGDGNLDLFVGERNGTILYYRGVAADSFALTQQKLAGIDVGFYAAPAFVDLDGDRRVDLLLGEGDGGINFFRGSGSTGVNDPIIPPSSFELDAYPNPFHERLSISLRITQSLTTPPRVTIYNLLGARVADLELRNADDDQWRTVWLPAELNLAAGVYFLKVNWGQQRMTRKILLVH